MDDLSSLLSPVAGSPAAVVTCLLAAVGALCSSVYLSRLPRNDDVTLRPPRAVAVGRTDCMTSPAVGWLSLLLSLTVHCCLLAAVTGTTCTVLLICVTAGVYHAPISKVKSKSRPKILFSDTKCAVGNSECVVGIRLMCSSILVMNEISSVDSKESLQNYCHRM